MNREDKHKLQESQHDKKKRFYLEKVIVPSTVALLTGGALTAIIKTSSCETVKSPEKQGVKSATRRLSSETQACSDGENRNPRRCLWLAFDVQPVNKTSTFKVDAVVDVDITIPDPEPNTNGCSLDPNINDPWREGWIMLSCGNGDEEKSADIVPTLPGHGRHAEYTLRASASCEANEAPVEIRLSAAPRGCSSMNVKHGSVTHTETPR